MPNRRLYHWYKSCTAVWMVVFCFPFLSVSADDTQTQDPAELREHAYEIYETVGPREALPMFEQVLALYRQSGDRSGEAITLGYIGNCHKRLGDYPVALEYHDRALTMKRELGDRREEGQTLSHIGLVYWEMGEYVIATDRFQASIDIANEIDDRRLRRGVLNNLSLVYDELGEYTKSLKVTKRRWRATRKTNCIAVRPTLLPISVETIFFSVISAAHWNITDVHWP